MGLWNGRRGDEESGQFAAYLPLAVVVPCDYLHEARTEAEDLVPAVVPQPTDEVNLSAILRSPRKPRKTEQREKWATPKRLQERMIRLNVQITGKHPVLRVRHLRAIVRGEPRRHRCDIPVRRPQSSDKRRIPLLHGHVRARGRRLVFAIVRPGEPVERAVDRGEIGGGPWVVVGRPEDVHASGGPDR